MNPQLAFPVGGNDFLLFEGPVWTGSELYFSEVSGGSPPPPSRISRFVPGGSVERGVFANTGSNGLALDANGDLLAATHDVGAIARFAVPSGARTAVGAQTFNNQRFNSPNDLVQRADGNIYFTDPTFQAPGNPQGGTRVYRISPTGEASIVDGSLGNPNGITLSPDGNRLYVAASGRFVRYDLAPDGTPGAAVTIQGVNINEPDGMTVDCAGNVYLTEHGARRVHVFDRDGQQLGSFGDSNVFQGNVTNVAFGGPNRTTLFITTTFQGGSGGGIYFVELNVPGLPY